MRILRREVGLAVLAGFLTVLLSAPLYGQTAARLEAMLDKPGVNWKEAAAFVLEAAETAAYDDKANLIEPWPWAETDPLQAFAFAADQKWLPKNAAPEDTAKLGGVALLLMQSFGLKGGIFYNIAKSPHYAYRELVYKRVIRGDTDPDTPVSGRDLLLMVSRLLSVKEAREAAE